MSSTFAGALGAAGLGDPKEFFSARFAESAADRWNIELDSGSKPTSMDGFLDALIHNTSVGGVFSAKVLFDQFELWLTNDTGKELFRDATVIMLCRADLRGQVVSLTTAAYSSVYGGSDPGTGQMESTLPIRRLADSAFYRTMRAEVGWRAFFAFSGVTPILITDEMLKNDLVGTVQSVAANLDRPVDLPALSAFAGRTRKYDVLAERKAAIAAELDTEFAPQAFDAESYSKLRLPRPGYSRWEKLLDRFSGRLRQHKAARGE